MRNDYELALKLRLKGKSYSDIKKILGTPKSTLSGWFKELQLRPELKKRIQERANKKAIARLLKRNKAQTIIAQKRAREIKKVSIQEVVKLTKRELFFVGVALYWAEGYKRPIKRNGRIVTHHSVSLTNSDPELIRVFLEFLREVCGVSEKKITANLRIYEHQNERNLLNFWIKITGIPESLFYKTYYGVSKSSQGKRPFNILPYGTIQIRVNNTNLFHRIMGWIEGLRINYMPR